MRVFAEWRERYVGSGFTLEIGTFMEILYEDCGRIGNDRVNCIDGLGLGGENGKQEGIVRVYKKGNFQEEKDVQRM